MQLGVGAVLAIRFFDIAQVGLLGLGTTSSVIMGAALGLYVPFPKKVLAGILAFAAGSLIAALAIELGLEGAHDLTRHGANVHVACYPSRFMEYALNRKREQSGATLALLSQCDLLRHLAAEDIEPLLDRLQQRTIKAGETVFRQGDPGDALYLVVEGSVEVLNDQHTLAEFGKGQAFGEMALLSGGTCIASMPRPTPSCWLSARMTSTRGWPRIRSSTNRSARSASSAPCRT
jgi:cyclic nucleotide-binding protein